MKLEQIKVGKAVHYESKARCGKGVIFAVDEKRTGTWVCVNDATNRRYVTVRVSQVRAAAGRPHVRG